MKGLFKIFLYSKFSQNSQKFTKIFPNIVRKFFQKFSKFYYFLTYSSNLCAVVGDLGGGTIRCLGDEVDGADEFQDFARVS